MNLKAVWVLILLVILSEPLNAWKWDTHETIVETVYRELPSDIKKQIDLPALKRGSLVPDKDLEDFENHSYPQSYIKAVYWLENAKIHRKKGEIVECSLDLGIASHYITDNFAAPHTTPEESSELHQLFEAQAIGLPPEIQKDCSSSLFSLMVEGASQGKEDWNTWVQTKDKTILQKELNTASTAVYCAFLSVMEDTPEPSPETTHYITAGVLLLVIVVVVLLLRKS